MTGPIIVGSYEKRTNPVRAVVIHTTGPGPVTRFEKNQKTRIYGWRTPFDAAVWYFTMRAKDGYHYLIGQEEGQEYQLCPEDFCAWHVGSRGGRPYQKSLDKWITKDTGWWARMFPTLTSPRDLADGHLWDNYGKKPSLKVRLHSLWGSVNANTIGIGIVPDAEGNGLIKPWTPACWRMLVRRIEQCSREHGFQVSQTTLLTHSICHPRARSARGAPWDPKELLWTYSSYLACRSTLVY